MNNAGFGSITAAHMERRLEEEVARQQQSAMLANEMARMNQQMNGMNNTISSSQFGNNSNDQAGFGAAGGSMSQRQQGFYDNNVDFLNVSACSRYRFESCQTVTLC